MKAQNQQEVNKKTLHFWLLFTILTVFILLQIFTFVWAARQQKIVYAAALQDYRETSNKQTVLREKVDSLYTQVSHLDIKKVDNYLYLESVIFDHKSNIANYINQDSTNKFSTYTAIISKLNNQLLMKDTLIHVETKENTVIRDLRNCIGKNKNMKSNILSQQRSY